MESRLSRLQNCLNQGESIELLRSQGVAVELDCKTDVPQASSDAVRAKTHLKPEGDRRKSGSKGD